MSLVQAVSRPPYIRSNASFVSDKSGDWSDFTTWKIIGVDGALYDSPYYPEEGNDVFIDPVHSVVATSDCACNNLYVHCTEAINKLDTGLFTLSFYGVMAQYTGSKALGTFALGRTNNAGAPFWITGTLSAKGSSRSITTGASGSYMIGQGSQGGGYSLYIDLDDNNQTLYLANVVVNGAGAAYNLGGGVVINTGNFRTDYNSGTRILTDVNPVPSGNTIISAGCALIPGQNYYRSAGVNLLTFDLQAGANLIFQDKGSRIISLIANSLLINGNVIVDTSYSTATTGSTTILPANFTSYQNLIFKQPGECRLAVNATINGMFIVSNATASLNKLAFSLSYGLTADLEYTVSKTIGTELISSGSGSSIPRNLILGAGVVLNLGGATVNIRGVLSLGAGASIVNGTLNQNQP